MPLRFRGREAVLAATLVVGFLAGCASTTTRPPAGPAAAPRMFTFAWRYPAGDAMTPRGGTTQGPAVELDGEPGEAWQHLRTRNLRPVERDRRAILAMAGTYRVTFDFLEVAGFVPAFTPDRPYQSWATEYVMVLRDEPRFIRLQHILVVFIQGKCGVEGPFVTKHWRQDWRYEDRDLLTYRGHETWAHERLAATAVRGTWTQAVFQVDDSPRYEGYGRWEHLGNVSTWRSSRTWRPLPRREFSVRSDYDVLIGTNRVTITPTGWVQQEENLKVALDATDTPSVAEVLAEEIGLERFERVRAFDDSAARGYYARTEPFWREVRAVWDEIIANRESFTLRAAPDRGQLFVPLFDYAERLAEGAPFDGADAVRFAHETVHAYLRDDAAARAARRR